MHQVFSIGTIFVFVFEKVKSIEHAQTFNCLIPVLLHHLYKYLRFIVKILYKYMHFVVLLTENI